MSRALIIAQLKPGMRERALQLLDAGPPFDPAVTGFDRHAVYLTDDEVIFLFEGEDAEWKVDDLISDAFHPHVQAALAAWRPLVDRAPRVGREAYYWEH